jgi:hypothetical protein
MIRSYLLEKLLKLEAAEGIALDTAYLSAKQWVAWNKRLKAMERRLGLKRIKVVSAPSEYGKSVLAYQVFYENPGIKIKRQAKQEISNMWSDFPNPLSRSFK